MSKREQTMEQSDQSCECGLPLPEEDRSHLAVLRGAGFAKYINPSETRYACPCGAVYRFCGSDGWREHEPLVVYTDPPPAHEAPHLSPSDCPCYQCTESEEREPTDSAGRTYAEAMEERAMPDGDPAHKVLNGDTTSSDAITSGDTAPEPSADVRQELDRRYGHHVVDWTGETHVYRVDVGPLHLKLWERGSWHYRICESLTSETASGFADYPAALDEAEKEMWEMVASIEEMLT